MYSIIEVTNKHTAKLNHVGSLYILVFNIMDFGGFHYAVYVKALKISGRQLDRISCTATYKLQ